MTSREQFEHQCRNGLVNGGLAVFENGVYVSELTRAVWSGWQASRAAIEVNLDNPVCWRTYYPDTDEESYRAHSESNEACARRIASEIGGYVVAVYHGHPEKVEAKK